MAQQTLANSRERYTTELQLHNERLKSYYSQANLYEEKKQGLKEQLDYYARLCRKDAGDSFACHRAKAASSELRRLKPPAKPEAPTEPDLASEEQRHQRHCSRICNCEAQYRTCYGACGGEVTTRRVCVSNCE